MHATRPDDVGRGKTAAPPRFDFGAPPNPAVVELWSRSTELGRLEWGVVQEEVMQAQDFRLTQGKCDEMRGGPAPSRLALSHHHTHTNISCNSRAQSRGFRRLAAPRPRQCVGASRR